MHPGALLLLAALPALGADVRGRIVPNDKLNLSSIPLDSRVELDFGASSALFRSDGSFELSGVSPGRHIVRPLIPGFAVHSYILSIPEPESESAAEGSEDAKEDKAEKKPHVQHYHEDRLALPTSSPSLPYPLEIAAVATYEYYTPPPGMNVVQMFKSPMVLMMLFSGAMALVLPKLTANLDNLDPELAKEFKDQQQTINKMQNSAMDWSGSLSGMLAAGTAGKEEGSSPRGSTPARGTPKRGRGGRR